jgi:hypothetical protein
MTEKLLKILGSQEMPFLRLENGTIIDRKTGKVIAKEKQGEKGYESNVLCSRNGTFYDRNSTEILGRMGYNQILSI